MKPGEYNRNHPWDSFGQACDNKAMKIINLSEAEKAELKRLHKSIKDGKSGIWNGKIQQNGYFIAAKGMLGNWVK